MNKCHVTKKLNGYLDNQLSEKEKMRVDAHIESCGICAEELIRLKVLSGKLKTWQVPGPEKGFESDVRNAIVQWELERGAAKMKNKTWLVLVPSLAMVLFVVLVGHVYMQKGSQAKFMQLAVNNSLGKASSFEYSKNKYAPYSSGVQESASWEAIADRDGSYGQASILAEYRAPLYTQEVNKTQVIEGGAYSNVTVFSKGGGGARLGETFSSRALNSDRGAGNGVTGSPYIGDGPVIVIQPSLPATGEGEHIIRIGTVKLEVVNGKDTYRKASEICKELGGYLGSSNFYKDDAGREAGEIIMRIPKDKFTDALDKLGSLGRVENISTDSRDVSQEYANLKAELDAAMVVYNKMLEALQKRQTSINEAARLESEITPILRRIADLKNRVEYFNNAISFTTVTLRFHESQVSNKVLKDSTRFIHESLINVGVNLVKFLAAAIPVTIVLVIVGVVMLALGLLVKRWIKRWFKRG